MVLIQHFIFTMTESASPSPTPEDAAAAQARRRKERREAKIKAGGSARLNKITGLGGGIQRGEYSQFGAWGFWRWKVYPEEL